ncbi:MAG: TonB-dependent receptor [Sphingomonadales bacterium]
MKSSISLNFYLSSVAAAAIAVAALAPAQSAQAQSDGATSQSSRYAIEEITVTAAKREQSLSDVGMSITALTGEALSTRGINSPLDLGRVVPGLTVQPTAFASPVFTLRGVGFFDTTLSAPPTVAVYVDEVSIPFSAETKGVAFDVQRVEVLKGPQGTLFGSNTTGGAINYIANRPSDEFEAGFNGTFGRFATLDATGYVSGPVAENVRMRLALRGVVGGAWQKSFTRDDKLGKRREINGRFITDWTPSDRLSISFTATGWRDTGETQAAQFLAGSCPEGVTAGACDPANRWQQNFQNYPSPPNSNRAADWVAPGTGAREDDIFGKPPERDDWFYMLSLRGDYNLTDNITLTSITAWSEFETDSRQDFDGTIFAGTDVWSFGTIETFSQELRVSGTTEKMNWIVGANFEDSSTFDRTIFGISEQGGYPFFLDPGPQMQTASQADANQGIQNIAAFANIEYQVLSDVTLIGGIRYTDTRRDFDGCSRDPGDNNFSPFWNRIFSFANLDLGPGDCFVFTENFPEVFRDQNIIRELNEDNIAWTVGVNYETPFGALLYGRVSQGYKAGSLPNFQAASVTQYVAVKQESLLAYEIGVKTPLFDNRANISAALFYYDYKDKQLKGRAPDPVFRDLDALVQIPKGEVQGAEFEINARPIDGLSLSVGGTIVRTRITDFNAVITFQGPTLDFSGQRFPYSPTVTLVADGQYDFPIGSELFGFVGASLTYNSSTSSALRNRTTDTTLRDDRFDIDAYTLIDLRAGVSSADDTWRVYAYGRNITDKYYWTTVLDNVSSIVRYTGQPATYGVGFSYNF